MQKLKLNILLLEKLDVLDLELTITEIFWFDGDYGVCCVHKFKDADDNSLIYFGNSKQFISEYDSKFKVKDKITVTATIKRHTKSNKRCCLDR